jgi:hypothetical protein
MKSRRFEIFGGDAEKGESDPENGRKSHHKSGAAAESESFGPVVVPQGAVPALLGRATARHSSGTVPLDRPSKPSRPAGILRY